MSNATKRFNSILVAFGLSIGMVGQASAEFLTTTYTGGLNDEGIMFDVLPATPIRLTGIQSGMPTAATREITVFTKVGTYVGSETTPGDWTSRGTQSLAAFAANTPSEVFQFPEPIQLLAGQRMAIFFHSTNINGVAYTDDGSVIGDLLANNSNLSIFTGSGVNGLFVNAFPNRAPNVTIYYTLVDTSPPTARFFGRRVQRTSDARVRLDGIADSDLGVAFVSVRFQRLRKNGSKRNVTRTVPVDSEGIFGLNVRTFKGRNQVRATATDIIGQASAQAAKVLVNPG